MYNKAHSGQVSGFLGRVAGWCWWLACLFLFSRCLRSQQPQDMCWHEIFPQYWYYWHTGHPVVALSSMVLSLVILFSGMVLLAGFSLWGVLLALVLDLLGLMAVLAYALFLRTLVPDLMLEQADFWILNQFVLPVIAAFVVNRLVTYGVARLLLGRI